MGYQFFLHPFLFKAICLEPQLICDGSYKKSRKAALKQILINFFIHQKVTDPQKFSCDPTLGRDP